MYPFKVILIGDDELLLPAVRRELLNQNVEIDLEYPDISSTVEDLSLHFDEDRLFICHIDSDEPTDALRRLSGFFAGRPIIALVESGKDSSFVVHAMRDGAAQVVMLPLDHADFREALTSVALQFGHSARASKVIAVSGAHGGVGATTVAVNLAYELAQTFELDTIVAELSLNCGVLATYLAIEPKFTTLELLQDGHEVDIYSVEKTLVPYSDRLSILAGPSHAVKAPKVSERAVSHLIDSLRQLAKVVVLDVPSTLDEAQLQALDTADEVVLIADQSVPSLQLTTEALSLGIRNQSPWVVINRFDPQIDGFDASNIRKALSIDELRTISLDQVAVRASVNCGQPLRSRFPKSTALADINALAQDLLGLTRPSNSSARAAGLMSTLGHALGFK